MKEYQANKLLKKYHLGHCSEEELSIIESWYNSDIANQTDLKREDVRLAKDEVWKNLPVHQNKKTRVVR